MSVCLSSDSKQYDPLIVRYLPVNGAQTAVCSILAAPDGETHRNSTERETE